MLYAKYSRAESQKIADRWGYARVTNFSYKIEHLMGDIFIRKNLTILKFYQVIAIGRSFRENLASRTQGVNDRKSPTSGDMHGSGIFPLKSDI